MPLPQSSPSLKKILVEWGLSEDSARFISESGYVLEDLLLSEPEDLGPITDLLSHPETLRLKRGILKARKETAESQITEIYEVPAEVDSLLIDAVPVIDVSVPPSKKPRTDPPVTNDTTQQVESSSTNSSQFNPLIPPQNFLNHSNGLINPSVQIVQLKPKKVIISSHEVLLQALQEDNKGTTILHLYKINKKLGEVEQGILANFIINTELSQENKFIKAARFKELSLFIKRIFPSEDEVTWYSPYKPLKNGHGIPARGRLLNAYYTARKALIRCGVTPSQREKFKKTPVSGTLDTGKELTKEEKEELLKKIDFIQKHSKPYKTVEAHWQDTYEYRNKGETPIHDYYSTYPILSTKDGYKLLVKDFLVRYPGFEHKFVTNWTTFVREFSEFVNANPTSYEAIIASFNIDLSVEDEDLATVNVARLLCLILDKAVGQLTKKDVVESFLCVVKNVQDVILKVEERKQKFLKLNRTVQPYPIIVVDDEQQITECYACVNNILYKLSSPMSALDVCFKIYHALDARYPTEAKGAWQFIQQNIYDIKTEYDDNLAQGRKLHKRLLEFKLKKLG